jgi:phytoene synthase
VRLPDEIVDSPSAGSGVQLDTWETDWLAAYEKKKMSHILVINEFVSLMGTYNIPPQYVQSYFAAMRQDLTKDRYATYEELEQYMYGSATVIGYMMSCIIGYRDGALPHARALGEAFQMTNFLRDIKADYDERGRIYLPLEDMKRFGVTERHIKEGIVDDAWISLMQYEINRARALYARGIAGIPMLSPHGRKAVYAAALIYKKILDKIEEQGGDVFTKRLVVSPFQKTVLLWKALWSRNQ